MTRRAEVHVLGLWDPLGDNIACLDKSIEEANLCHSETFGNGAGKVLSRYEELDRELVSNLEAHYASYGYRVCVRTVYPYHGETEIILEIAWGERIPI